MPKNDKSKDIIKAAKLEPYRVEKLHQDMKITHSEGERIAFKYKLPMSDAKNIVSMFSGKIASLTVDNETLKKELKSLKLHHEALKIEHSNLKMSLEPELLPVIDEPSSEVTTNESPIEKAFKE